ncbi:NeuD/PglB/VioB family sugar acetyltransferase [Actinoplanes sp. NPDC051475]|uniref:NeuD/PglB/VioB family sugar acetyltransferase n=1 Tax=Actinoplanes sp. NPDC051475 TaxID=3157225 RepID=UPI00344E3B77
MSDPLVIVGCGGHGREVYGVVHAVNEAYGEPWKVLGFVDDAPSDVNLGRLERLGVPFLGDLGQLAGMGDDVRYVIGIGDPRVRAKVAAKIGLAPAGPLVHPDASVGLGNEFGDGVVLLAGVRVTTNVTLGRHVHLNQNATVGHDSVLGDFVQVNPLAAVSGDCRLGERVLIGTTAAVLQGLSVGAGATVGAGACVVRPVPSDTVVKGVPAR